MLRLRRGRQIDRLAELVLGQRRDVTPELSQQRSLLCRRQERLFDRSKRETGELGGRIAEGVAQALVVGGQRGLEHRRVVGVDRQRHAGAVQTVEGVFLHAREHAQADVRRRADLERNAPRPQLFDQAGVVARPHAVSDALGARDFERVADDPRPAMLTGMGGAVETPLLGLREVLAEGRRGRGGLEAREPERHDRPAVRRALQGVLERQVGLLGHVAHDVEDQPHPDAALLRAGADRLTDGVENLSRVAAFSAWVPIVKCTSLQRTF
jgi:hypothetical protein